MYKLSRDGTSLLVIDMQERLASVMDRDMFETVVSNTAILALSFQMMNLPVIESLQNPKGLGNTVEDLEELSPDLQIEKTTFSVCKSAEFVDYLKKNKIKNVVLTGMEAHICVLETALDLLEAGYNVHIAADAVVSRNDFNWETALDIAQKAGAVISVTETIIYQLLGSSEAKEFKDIQKLLK